MDIFQQVHFVTSAPQDVKVILGAFFLILVTELLSLGIESAVYPFARNTTVRFLSADYWIRRQKRRAIAYRHMAEQAKLPSDAAFICSKWSVQEERASDF